MVIEYREVYTIYLQRLPRWQDAARFNLIDVLVRPEGSFLAAHELTIPDVLLKDHDL